MGVNRQEYRQELAFLFPGQGSQAVGMLDGFAGNAAVAEAIAEASQAISLDISALVAQGPAETLNLTVNTQPVMLACAVAFFNAYRAAGGPMPTAMAGHSLGEYSALVAAGAISLADATALVRFRAEAMQQAVPVGQGGMAAVLGLASQRVQEVCVGLSQPQAVVEAVYFNAPDQTVIAGHLAAVEAACAALKAAGAKRALMLPVSAPFHSSLLSPAAQALADRLANVAFNAAQVPVWHNLNAQPCGDAASIRQALAAQAKSPVLWTQTIEGLSKAGITSFIECGPGKVLAGLVKRIAPEARVLSIYDQASLGACMEALQ
jgi:[acyl-carrier-protein] S-malonyltransferase